MRILTWNVDGLKPVLLRRSESISKMLEILDAGAQMAYLIWWPDLGQRSRLVCNVTWLQHNSY